jgi:hypothetical protein
VAHTHSVSKEGLGVCHQVVADSHGLGPLKMRVPGHRPVRVLRGAGDEDCDHLREGRGDIHSRVPTVEAEVERYLVVARAAGVEAAAHLRTKLRQPALDRGVDVLVRRPEVELVVHELVRDPAQAVLDRVQLRLVEQSGRVQSPRVRDGTGDVVEREFDVQGQ